MTSLDRLEQINKFGLIPRNENNSKLINDNNVKVYFSEGFTGCIALFVDFDRVYNKIKNKEENLKDFNLNKRITSSKNLEEYLGEGVYLCFAKENIVNERNFENGCTSKTIKSEKLKVVILKDKNTNKVIYSRFAIIKYMMSKTKIEDIMYYGTEYKSPLSEIVTKKIQAKVKKYYQEHTKEINDNNLTNYDMLEIPLNKFLNEYIIKG